MLAALQRIGRIGFGVMVVAMATIFFCKPHRLLPSAISASGPTFLGFLGGSFVALAVRVYAFGGTPLVSQAAMWALLVGSLVLFVGGARLAIVCLVLASSIGVDIVSSALAHMGLVDLNSEHWFQGWEVIAMILALWQRARETRQLQLPTR